MIIANNPRHHSDRLIFKDDRNLFKNMETIVITMRQVGVKLKTLKVRYWSCYGGDIESVRQELEGPIRRGMPERPIMIKDYHQNMFDTFRRKDAEQRIFMHACGVLAPLRGFKNIADNVSVRGDVTQAMVDELEQLMAVDGEAVKKKKEAAAKK